MTRDTLDFAIRSAVAWLFRSRNAESWIFRGAVTVLVVLHGANWFFRYNGSFEGRPVSVEFGTAGVIPESLLLGLSGLCALLMAGAAGWAWTRYAAEQRRLSRKKVFVIEGRGLRDDDGSPLLAAVPETIPGTRVPYLLDLRQRKDGVLVEPDDLLRPVEAMRIWLHQMQKGNDRSDLTTVYGGLTAVPLTFLTGVLLDDEGDIVVMDWDRTSERWKSLNGPDDTMRFEVSGLEMAAGASEVVLAISLSYPILSDNLETTFAFPVIRMTMPDLQSSHWSQAKQAALADQFLGALKQLEGLGVHRIHLVLAAPNSVVFNFGRRYDRRNVPAVTVYQFERAQDPRYPWGIEMPVGGFDSARVVYTTSSVPASP
ncbi:SAVED domain-containing protein [Microvirga sp. BT688]|uniref:SAVED domain-containing protein n=1 Tax=Microvirga sp. TaxID=1873136 RepID=UPI0016834B89|nr:SAVED domain-containing protein [Microvirga sp.]MBD2746632.1 SAVED domain-containing protein [Microvirga sp.]